MAVPNSLAQTVVAVARMGQRHAPMNSPGAIRFSADSGTGLSSGTPEPKEHNHGNSQESRQEGGEETRRQEGRGQESPGQDGREESRSEEHTSEIPSLMRSSYAV